MFRKQTESNAVAETQPNPENQQKWAERVANGEITLAEYVGLSKKDLYVIAEQAHRLLQSGRLAEARDIYQGLVAADPYDSVFHCHLGAALFRLGNTTEAKNQFDLALQYNIANVDALVGRGEIFLSRGELKEALGDLRRALEIDPTAKRQSTMRARAALLALKNSLEKQQSAGNA